MAFDYEEKPSHSKYVEAIWKTEDRTDGVYMAPADAGWDLIFITESGKTRVLLSGPTTQPTPLSYKAGNKNIGIRFRLGTFMTRVSGSAMRNVVDILPMQDERHFILFDHVFAVPTFETADELIAEFESLGFLGPDHIVNTALGDKTPAATQRSIQRHFKDATGVVAKTHQRVKQAQRAVSLLRNGSTPIEAAHEAGYADQAHMTRVLKQLTGYTPAEIIASNEPIIVERHE